MALDNEYARERVLSLRKRIAGPPETREDELTPEDRNILVKFDDQLTRDRKKNNRCGWYHHGNLLSELFILAVETKSLATTLDDGHDGRAALDDVLEWIHDQDYSGYTIQGKLSTLRVFAETVLGELPERFEEIEPGRHVEDDPAPLPSNIVEYTDVIKMVEEVDAVRDKALLLVQWSTGMRPMEELYTLQKKNVKIYDDHVVLSLPEKGKTDRRDIMVVVGSQLLRKWVTDEHPAHHDPESSMNPDTFLWTKQNENKHLLYGSLTTRFSVAGERAGIEKDHSPQHFRRSAASVLAGQPYINERDLRHRFSWSPNSDSPEHYIAANSDATKVNVARCRGQDIEGMEGTEDTAPVVCARCGDWTTRGLEGCIWCQHDLDGEETPLGAVSDAAMQDPRSAGEKDLAQMLLDGDVTADELRTLQKMESVVKSEPELFERLDQLITKADALEEAAKDERGSALAVSGPFGAAASVSSALAAASRKWARAKHLALRVHPGFEHYPPRGGRLAALLAGWFVILAGAIAAWDATGILDDVLAGEPLAVLALVVSLAVGSELVRRDLPSVRDALRAASSSN